MKFTEYQDKAKTTAQYPNLKDLVIARMIGSGIIKSLEWGMLGEAGIERARAIFSNPYYPALGLAGEVGEFCNKLKKVMRDNDGEIDSEFLEFAEGELGDIQWYLAALCSELGLDLEKIAIKNLEKLASRKERGKIQGNGDNR